VPILVGYGIGSLPLGYLVANRLKGIDLRRVGSGNVGAANVYRTAGLALGLLVAAVDVVKGATSVFFAAALSGGAGEAVVPGVAPHVGRVSLVGRRFLGGEGVATACGVFWMLVPLAAAVPAPLFVLTVGLTRYVSRASVLAPGAKPP